MLPDLVVGDREQPRFKLGTSPESPEISKRLEHAFLEDVVGILGKIDRFEDKIVDLPVDGSQVFPKQGRGASLVFRLPHVIDILLWPPRSREDPWR